ncbi:MAG: DMT family transporter [Thermoplasmata archaeon]|nr:DMT family transporter [Thermoplasmata archaeon]
MKNYRDAVLFVFMSLFWSINYPLVKIAVLYENEYYLLFFRILFALILSLILFPKSLKVGKSFKTHLKFLVIALLNIVGFMEFWFIGEMSESASISSIIIYTYPVFVVLLSIPLLNEKVKKLNLSGSFIGLAGIVLIFFQEMQIKSIYGLIFLFLGSLSWSFGTIFYKKYMNEIEPVKVNTMQFVYALPITFIIALISGPLIIGNLNIEYLSITAYMGMLGTSMAYFIYLHLFRKYNVSEISSYLFIVPAFSVIISAIFLKEILTGLNLIGFILLIIGIYLSQRK